MRHVRGSPPPRDRRRAPDFRAWSGRRPGRQGSCPGRRRAPRCRPAMASTTARRGASRWPRSTRWSASGRHLSRVQAANAATAPLVDQAVLQGEQTEEKIPIGIHGGHDGGLPDARLVPRVPGLRCWCPPDGPRIGLVGLSHGRSPYASRLTETIPSRLAHVSVAQVLDALSYFSDHQEEVQRWMDRDPHPGRTHRPTRERIVNRLFIDLYLDEDVDVLVATLLRVRRLRRSDDARRGGNLGGERFDTACATRSTRSRPC